MRSSSHTCMYLLDMSVGANIVLSSIIACNASVKFGYAGLIIAPLICGTIIGLINGIVYIKLHISSLIVTCALSLIYEALSVYTTNGKNVILSTEYRAFGDYPVNLILALIAYFLCAFILKYTKIGIYTYAIGSNEVVAKNMGVNVSKYKIVAFTLAGFFFGLAFKKYGHPVVAIVIGENGSGKSTLTSCLTGIYQKDSGKFILEGKEITATNQVEANHQGVAIIVQEIGTFSGLTVAENIFLGNEDKFTKHGIKNTAAMNKQAQEYLDSYGFNYIDATKVIDDYNFEDRKLVEIVKATYFNPKVLVVDEATTALGQKGREELFKVMHKVRDTGNCVIFISHDIEEVIEQADNISVLRDGVKIGSITKAEATPDKLKALMVGREIGDNYYRTDYGEEISKEIVLSAKNVTVKGQIEDLNLELHKGEILGIGGLSECGMHEVGKALFGASYFRQGTVTLGDGTPINSIPDAITVCLAPDHLAQALIGVSRVHQHHVRTLLVVLPHEVVHKKGFAAARRTQHELVAVGRDTPLHRQVADVEVQRFSRKPVHHLDAEGRERTAVVGFLREEAHRLLNEGVETLFRLEVRRVAGHRRPVERRAVDSVVAGDALHAGKLAAHIVLDMLQFLRVIAPRHDVEVRPYRGQPVGMGFVQVLVYPLAVDAVAPAVSG